MMYRVIPLNNGLWRIEGVRQRYFTAAAAYFAAAQFEHTLTQHRQFQRAMNTYSARSLGFQREASSRK